MKFFLDSAIVEEIEHAFTMWGFDGVTTNPRHVQASGKPFLKVIREIAALAAGTDRAISVEVNPHHNDPGAMVEEGLRLAAISPNFVIKLPATEAGFKAIPLLKEHGVRANLTLVFSAAQALQARKEAASDRNLLLRALDYYDYARGLGELPPEILPAYGSALMHAGRFEEAAQALSAALEQAPEAPGGLSEVLKRAQQGAQQVRLLEERVREVENTRPEDQAVQLLRAQSLIFQNRPLQAGYLLEHVMSREDAMSAAWVLLGYARAWMGQDEGFLSEWPVPPVPDGEQAEQWTKLAQFCAGRGDWSAAERYLTHATEQYPGASAPWLVLCDLAIARNNAPAARQHLAEAELSLIHISEPTRLLSISYAVFCLKKKKNKLLTHQDAAPATH